MNVQVFVEGGGQKNQPGRKDLESSCRRAFSELTQKVGLTGRTPRFVACGSRSDAFHDFRVALRSRRRGEVKLLLVDSEMPVPESALVWEHVRQREGDGWERPNEAQESDLHFMVQCMEAWFFADINAVQSYFGNGFRSANLTTRPIEEIPKQDIANQLKAATRATPKGEYDKGRHSFEILRQIDARRIENASPFAKRFFNCLREVC